MPPSFQGLVSGAASNTNTVAKVAMGADYRARADGGNPCRPVETDRPLLPFTFSAAILPLNLGEAHVNDHATYQVRADGA